MCLCFGPLLISHRQCVVCTAPHALLPPRTAPSAGSKTIVPVHVCRRVCPHYSLLRAGRRAFFWMAASAGLEPHVMAGVTTQTLNPKPGCQGIGPHV